MNTTENIWNDYHRRLAAFIRIRVEQDAADDILQDVFKKIHTRLSSLKDSKKLESWLFQITRHVIIDHYRARRPTGELPVWIEQPERSEEESIRKELSSCLVPMIQQLPDKYRKALELSEIQGKTQKEVAEHEGITLSGAKSRIQRGRALLKSTLDDCCRFELDKHNRVIAYENRDDSCGGC